MANGMGYYGSEDLDDDDEMNKINDEDEDHRATICISNRVLYVTVGATDSNLQLIPLWLWLFRPL